MRGPRVQHDRGAVRRGVEPSGAAVHRSSTSPHVTSRRATRRARAASAPAHALHKIDSTLRGSWAHEVVGRQQAHCRLGAGGARVPGRGAHLCGRRRDVDGVPVAERRRRDRRSTVPCARADPPTTSATRGRQRSTPSRRPPWPRWLETPAASVARCATRRTDEDLEVIADAWSADSDVVLAGTAAVDRRSRQRGAAARRASARAASVRPAGARGVWEPAPDGARASSCGRGSRHHGAAAVVDRARRPRGDRQRRSVTRRSRSDRVRPLRHRRRRGRRHRGCGARRSRRARRRHCRSRRRVVPRVG